MLTRNACFAPFLAVFFVGCVGCQSTQTGSASKSVGADTAASAPASSVASTGGASVTVVTKLSWAEVLEQSPDATVITDAAILQRITATGLPWRVRDNASGIEMLLIPPGTFMMGAPEEDNAALGDERNQHEVIITKPFYLGRTEVTQKVWKSEMPENPSIFVGDSLPVENVTWNIVQSFCKQNDLRLPTEAEWEYASRAGTTQPRYGALDEIAWYRENSARTTHPVASKTANAFGLYDTTGNVFEWVQDFYDRFAYQDRAVNPTGPTGGDMRVMRGGSWNGSSVNSRSSARYYDSPDEDGSYVGFRVARSL